MGDTVALPNIGANANEEETQDSLGDFEMAGTDEVQANKRKRVQIYGGVPTANFKETIFESTQPDFSGFEIPAEALKKAKDLQTSNMEAYKKDRVNSEKNGNPSMVWLNTFGMIPSHRIWVSNRQCLDNGLMGWARWQ